MFASGVRVAYGGFAAMRAGGVSVVSSVAAAVRAVDLDGADHHLDGEHHPDLLCLAFARHGPSVAGSGLDYAAGIRDGGRGRWNYWVTPNEANGEAAALNRVASTPDGERHAEPFAVEKNAVSRDVFGCAIDESVCA